MMPLHCLLNTSREKQKRKRVGRGIGSGIGKTCGRGVKGAGARSGYKTRTRYEGGQLPLYRKLPQRGFNNARFRAPRFDTINLAQIEEIYQDGEIVNLDSLYDKGFLSGPTAGIKILGHGEVTKKVTIEAQAFSASAEAKLKESAIPYSLG
uniref:Large ribosomal subunit protein uL15 n=1 Tax=Chlamydiales bacterium PN TaxID=1910939 RepID=A0A1K0K0W4_9CHLA|nr:50S ribosomal protein L15 [Chlamydiales bacterium PN]